MTHYVPLLEFTPLWSLSSLFVMQPRGSEFTPVLVPS